MYIIDTIKTAYKNLNAWRQNQDTQSFMIAESLTIGESGLSYQDAHPLLTLNNLISVAPNFAIVTYDAWLIGTAYIKDSRVTYNTINYKAKQNNTGKQPDTSLDDWEVFDAFSEWLLQFTEASITRTIQKFLNEKKVIKTARSIYENKPLFNGAGSFKDLINNAGDWVGFELATARSKGITVKIEKLGFQSNKAETIDIYLFHSSSKVYVKKQSITTTAANEFVWFSLTDWFLGSITDDYNAGGSWYIVYNQNQLTGQSINTIRDWSQKPCNCSRSDYNLYNLWSKYVAITPFSVDYENENLWDVEDMIYTNSLNYGLNLQLSVYCDYTDFIVEQRDIFKDIIYYGVAIDGLRLMAYNPDSKINRNVENTIPGADKILYEISGNSPDKSGGLVKDFETAMEAIKLDTEEMNITCLPCRKNGIRYTST